MLNLPKYCDILDYIVKKHLFLNTSVFNVLSSIQMWYLFIGPIYNKYIGLKKY